MSRHAIEQARGRYGIDLNEGDLAQMGRAVLAGETVLLKRQAHGCEVHAVQISIIDPEHAVKNVTMGVLAVWNVDHRRIVTFLPASSGGRSHASVKGQVAVKNMGNFKGKRGRAEARKRDRRIIEEETEL